MIISIIFYIVVDYPSFNGINGMVFDYLWNYLLMLTYPISHYQIVDWFDIHWSIDMNWI